MKNIQVFKAALPTQIDIQSQLSEAEGMLFKPCTKTQASTFGFNGSDSITKLENGYKINFASSAKNIKRKAIKSKLTEWVMLADEYLDFELTKDDLNEIKEGVVLSLVKSTMAETTAFDVYYHEESETVIVDANDKLAQISMGLICQLLKSVETKTLHCSGISNSLTLNVKHQLELLDEETGEGVDLSFAGFDFGDLLILKNEDGTKAQFKGDYPLSNIQELIGDGYEVVQLNLRKDDVSFTLNDSFKIKGIKSHIDPVEESEDLEDEEQNRLHEESVLLEIMVSHCDTLREQFDRQSEY